MQILHDSRLTAWWTPAITSSISRCQRIIIRRLTGPSHCGMRTSAARTTWTSWHTSANVITNWNDRQALLLPFSQCSLHNLQLLDWCRRSFALGQNPRRNSWTNASTWIHDKERCVYCSVDVDYDWKKLRSNSKMRITGYRRLSKHCRRVIKLWLIFPLSANRSP